MIKVTVKNKRKLKKQLVQIENDIKNVASDDLARDVHKLERNIILGAPVDTGRYRLAWETIRTGKYSWEIHNSVEYAKYLIFGSIHHGIIHDVRGIVRYWNNHIRGKVQSKL